MKTHLPGKLNALGILVLFFNSLSAQDFTWIKGSNLVDQSGVYGTMGTPAPSNNPGSRQGAITWKDAAGNFWLFGGLGNDHVGNLGELSDLWKYTPATNQWVFIKGNDFITQLTNYSPMGIPSALGKPGGRHSAASWTDASGNLWLMGGYGYSGGSGLGYLNDLWKYDILSNMWTYVNGSAFCFQPGTYGTMGTPSSSNTPGTRMGSASWTDASGDLWLFGGYGNTTSSTTIGYVNDVWRYNIASNAWTWIKGSNIKDQNGSYGTIATSSPTNNPGSRAFSTGWPDGAGNFWILGGDGWDATASTANGKLNDLWKYNITTNEWTWIKGSSTYNQNGIYSLQGLSNSTNMPGGRSGSISWKDAVGNFWLFGGEGYPNSGTAVGALNDLWKYNTASNEWAWIKGTSLVNQNGVYGSLSVPALTNLPGARSLHSGWIDSSNDLYIFGGQGQAASGPAGNLNDMWKYTNCFISPITMTIIAKDSSICTGETTSLTVSGSSNYLWVHNLSPNSYAVISPSTTILLSLQTVKAVAIQLLSRKLFRIVLA